MGVRAASPDDLPTLVALEAECEGVDAWSEHLVRDGLENQGATTHWLLDDDQRGYAVVSVAADIAELQRIGVSEQSRKQGLGRSLLDEAVRLAAGKGANRMLLEVRDDNRAALNLYAGKGFVEIDRRPRYYKDGATAIVMRLPLMKGCG